MGFELKRLPRASLQAAIEKAEHYRDLNQPEEAESICRDVLDVDNTHQTAWKLLGLALPDRFASGKVGLVEEEIESFGHITDPYQSHSHLRVRGDPAPAVHLA